MRITKKWHNKYGARIVCPKYFPSVSTNRTHEKTENAANERKSDSTAPTP